MLQHVKMCLRSFFFIIIIFFSSPCFGARAVPAAEVRQGLLAEGSPCSTTNSQTFCFHYLKVLLNSKPAVGMTSSNQEVSPAKWDLIARGLRYKLMNLNNKTLLEATYGTF